MRGLDPHGLLANNGAHIDGKLSVFERVAIFGDGGVFAALAFREDGVFIAAAQRGFDVDPAAVQGAGETAGRFGFLADTADEALQFGDILLPLHGEFAEERFEVGVLYRFGGGLEAVLAVLAGFDEGIQDGCDGVGGGAHTHSSPARRLADVKTATRLRWREEKVMNSQPPLPNEDEDIDPAEIAAASDETPTDVTPPELDSRTKKLTAWDEPPSATGTVAPRVVPEDETSIAEQLVYEGTEEADRERRLAAADPDFEP